MECKSTSAVGAKEDNPAVTGWAILCRASGTGLSVGHTRFQAIFNRKGMLGFATILRMVIHTFAFRWKAGVTEEQKMRARSEIRALQGQIPGLLETHVGFNFSPRGQGYEFGGVMKFTDRAALEAYGPSPVHQKLLEWLVPLIEPIEVDFEV